MLERCCNYLKQCRDNVAKLCCAKNRRCESSCVTSPLVLLEQTGKDKGHVTRLSKLTVNARTDWMNEKSKHYSDKHFEKLIGILGFYTAGQLKNPRNFMKKNNF